ncbi:MAG: hypothetical protein PUP92_21740 [Rhizonema sp. PD38]|nr:hypothetical protein [Rhizonema sp. PD38]
MNQSNFCCCTLALGDNYCALSLDLAKDLEMHSPEIRFVVLTDRPQYFSEQSNVLAFEHHQLSLGCYHDKRFSIAKALSIFHSCLFLDADMRILAPIPANLEWEPGITAKIVWNNILKHNKNQFEIKLLEQMAQKLNLQLEEISFVHECLFVVTRDSGLEQDFIQYWDKIAPYFELRGFYRGEGHTIGLAAAKAGLTIRQDPMEKITFFKDKLELQAIKKGTSNYADKAIFFERQQSLEYPHRSIYKKLLDKLERLIGNFYRTLRLRIMTFMNLKFYYF